MHRFLRRLVLPGLVAALQVSPAPLAAQLVTNPLPTRELYRLAREKATEVNDRCVGALSSYLEAVGYMYAYIQAAGRDGSLRSDPAFEQGFRQQFNDVLDRAQRCLKAYPPLSASAMRSDETRSSPAEPPPPGVILPAQPPASPDQPDQPAAPPGGVTIRPKVVTLTPGASQQFSLSSPDGRVVNLSSTGGSITSGAVYTAGGAPGGYTLVAEGGGLADTAYIVVVGSGAPQTDALGRTIPMLVAQVEQLLQDRGRLEAEVAQLRGAAPPPAPAPVAARTGVAYRVRVKADGRFWHLHGNVDNLLSTRYQPDDDFTRFSIVSSGDGAWRIRNKATGNFLYADDASGNYLISARAEANDDHTVFLMFLQPDGSYRIQNRATGRYVHEDGSNDLLVSTRYQVDDDFTRFIFVP
jgi:hypothetical protein